MTFIPDDLYASIEASIPIVCVDFVLVRSEQGRACQVGLIERRSPYGDVWCHLGGRIRLGETIAHALSRHLDDALVGAAVEIGIDPQPDHIYQWFPPSLAPSSDLVHGTDQRKHAIGLSFLIEETGAPQAAQGEALDFRYFPLEKLPTRLWPGCSSLLEKLLPELPAEVTGEARQRACGTTRRLIADRLPTRSATSTRPSRAC